MGKAEEKGAAAGVADLRMARGLAQTFERLEAAEEEIDKRRKLWRQRREAAWNALRVEIEADDDGTPERARDKCNAVAVAYQAFEEIGAARKDDMHLALTEAETLRAKMRTAIASVRQLSLFDDDEGGQRG